MQSNDNPEMKDILNMDNSRAITVPLSTEMGEDTRTITTAPAPADPAEVEVVAKARNMMGLDDGMMPPPTVQVQGQASAQGMATLLVAEPRPPSSASATSDKDEDEVLSLQVLSGRSSTPYTVQAVCCGNANCELSTTDSTTVSPVKEEASIGLASDGNKDELVVEMELRPEEELEGKKYTRLDLMSIRDEMTVVRPECLGSMKLKRLNLIKSENGTTNGSNNNGGGNRNKAYRSANTQNDLMPAFFKRKTIIANGNANSITYDTFKYNDSHPFGNRNEGGLSNNHRRIGSGRLSNRDINWDYIPEEDPEKDNLPEFFTAKPTDPNNNVKQQQRHSKKYELDDNSNYVKRVINSVVGESSFRSGGSKNSNNSSTEERYSTNSSSTSTTANNKSDEPEWFSCGPTSRLDTIELCGFDESDERQIRLELANVKPKPDANNNHEEQTTTNAGGAGGHKEKKHLAFQFDDFSTHAGKANSTGGGTGGNRMGASKFLPLFNTKNKEVEKAPAAAATAATHNGSQSLSDFFKRNDLPSVQKEKLSLTEIPSVDEIEAKCRIQQQQNETKNKTAAAETLSHNAENFKKMINQLNQQNPGLATVSSPPHQPQQPGQPILNLFNSENLTNFIKQRNLHQQLLQKQQQAAFAQLQLNAILSRPETQMLLLSLARGEISKHGLIVQLANPNLTQADRETISAVLTFSAAGQYQQQLAISNNHQQQQQFIANQLQNLALLQQMNKSTIAKRNAGAGFQANGSGGGGGSNLRTYSQEELQSHANYILHNAMMKKKLEEQTNLGVQKFLQLQNSMLNNGYVHNSRGNESLAGSKNQQQQQQQQHQQQTQQQQQRQRKSSNGGGNRGNHSGRRRSTSSSSSNATVNAAQMKLAADLEFRQLEQRRNTIATSTVAADEFLQISQNI